MRRCFHRARIITTNNYAIVPKTLSLAGETSIFGVQDLEQLVEQSAKCAQDAVKEALAQGDIDARNAVRIAGCLPPLGASYKPEEVGTFDEMTAVYDRITAALAPHVDVFLCETMSTGLEAKAAATSASKHGLPVWVAWTLEEEAKQDAAPLLRSGESIETAVGALDGIAVGALLFNCTSVGSITKGMAILRKHAAEGVQVGGYANGFVTVKSDGSGSDYDKDLTPEVYADTAKHWVDDGAALIGGCCGVFPEHIAEISARPWAAAAAQGSS